ncbi:glycosyltransferase [Halomonas alkaliantarctica]|uniref:glycosyltransferase n=1 Tax=Halomonas alkaliantarctica TaxID=232346 RepID=UPI0004A9DCC3|nr:glycosyltransferase [Halomonas alkaliantarctica]
MRSFLAKSLLAKSLLTKSLLTKLLLATSLFTKRWRKRRANEPSTTTVDNEGVNNAGFDPAWYLAAYPDVAAAGVDPWDHYQQHGKAEGRLPCRNQAIGWGHALWRGADAVVLPRLQLLLTAPNATLAERLTARWELARWYAWQTNWPAVLEVLLPENTLPGFGCPGPALLVVDACCQLFEDNAQQDSALAQALAFLETHYPDHADTALAKANALSLLKEHLTSGTSLERLAVINRYFQAQGLQPVTLADPKQPLHLYNLAPDYSVSQGQHLPRVSTAFGEGLSRATGAAAHDSPFTTQHSLLTIHHSLPFISVVIPLYNAEHTIAIALTSLFCQQGVRLEIIVVDDASSDNSVTQVEQLQDSVLPHITLMLLRHTQNQGAYAARNTGMAAATAPYITTHDSDDWSHPQKLALQCQQLIDQPSIKACLSHWVRVTPELMFHRWRLDEYGWVYPNMSSLMFRREVFEALGYWDGVKVNADTEWRWRVDAAFGAGSVSEVLPGVPLSFGLADSGSLSQHSASHLVSQFIGNRFRYMQLAGRWHRSSQRLFMPIAPTERLFTAPADMLRATAPPNPPPSEFELISESGLLDAGWYLTRYIDLQHTPVEPLNHYVESGASERRDPGPGFSTSGYVRRYPEAAEASMNPLAHYLSVGQAKGYLPHPEWQGERVFANRPTVILCGHQAGSTLFGAERSLVDVLDAMGELRWNVVVTLPEANNLAYEKALLQRCKALVVLPYGWWQVGKQADNTTVAQFEALIARYNASALHGNTAVLHEPYIAAKRAGVPALVHVRELPAFDESLCALLGATPSELVAQVHQLADVVVANSRCVAEAFTLPSSRKRLAIVPNTIAMLPLLTLPDVDFNPQARVRVGMLSSNVAKKGLQDVEQMAAYLSTLAPRVEVVLFGGETPAIADLQRRQAQGKAPINIRFSGYVEHPETALAQLDIVVNLSRFQESFGRTVLEAMAAARPVVAYNWGALSELVVADDVLAAESDEEATGILVPFGDTMAAAEQVAKLAGDVVRCRQLGKAARQRAQLCFSAEQLRQALANVYTLTQREEFS